MRSTTTRALAGLLLLAGLLAGCGGEGGNQAAEPEPATDKEYCDAFAAQFDGLSEMDPKDTEGAIGTMKDWATTMGELEPPKGMPADARKALAALVDEIGKVEPDASREELEQMGRDRGPEFAKELEALGAYTMETCPDLMRDMMGEPGDPTEAPSN